jgi:hypothetical protein
MSVRTVFMSLEEGQQAGDDEAFLQTMRRLLVDGPATSPTISRPTVSLIFAQEKKMNNLYELDVTVNGKKYHQAVDPRLLLSDFLRHKLGLTGTHVGCEHGVCGACTILFYGEPVRSCLMFAVQANGHELVTVEGLGTRDNLHPCKKLGSPRIAVRVLHTRYPDDGGAFSGEQPRP